jgi:hypothetical protein
MPYRGSAVDEIREQVMFGNWKQVSLAMVGSILLTATSVGAAIGPASVSPTASPSLAVKLVSGQAVI